MVAGRGSAPCPATFRSRLAHHLISDAAGPELFPSAGSSTGDEFSRKLLDPGARGNYDNQQPSGTIPLPGSLTRPHDPPDFHPGPTSARPPPRATSPCRGFVEETPMRAVRLTPGPGSARKSEI